VREDNACSLEFTVGDVYSIGNQQWTVFPEEGIVLKCNESVIIETYEEIGVPFNMFGLVTGVGRNIQRGLFVSTGKIDPGFSSRLKIGILNTNKKKQILKKGDLLCSCFFIQLESSIDAPFKDYSSYKSSSPFISNHRNKFLVFIKTYWDKMLTIGIALAALIWNIYK
jgi:deoxycytidine triphosphate deaminase